MLELLETIAYVIFWVCVAAFAFSFALRILDILAKLLFFTITKIAIDRSVRYDTFSISWDDAKRKV